MARKILYWGSISFIILFTLFFLLTAYYLPACLKIQSCHLRQEIFTQIKKCDTLLDSFAVILSKYPADDFQVFRLLESIKNDKIRIKIIKNETAEIKYPNEAFLGPDEVFYLIRQNQLLRNRIAILLTVNQLLEKGNRRLQKQNGQQEI